MPAKAKLYVVLVILTATAVTVACLIARRQFPELPRYLLYLLLALAASVLKVRLPGYSGTISVSFLFVLIAVADFSLLETIAMASGGALIQWDLFGTDWRMIFYVNLPVSVGAFVAAIFFLGESRAPAADRLDIPGALLVTAGLFLLVDATFFAANMVTGGTTGAGAGFTSRVITSPDGDIAEDRVVVAAGTYRATAPTTRGAWVR